MAMQCLLSSLNILSLNTPFISGIVVAAGQGKRFGLGIPKQFLKIKGQPLLAYTINNLLKIGILSELIIVVSDDRINSKELKACLPLPSSVPIKIIAGGEHRQDSVFNGMQVIDSQAEIVVVHDGVRPFVMPELVRETVRLCSEFDGAILAIPAVDTLKEVENGQIVRTIERSRIWQAQTPQTFRREVLERAYANARQNNIIATDDAMLVELIGGKVAVVKSTPDNFKITCQNDLKIAKSILKLREP